MLAIVAAVVAGIGTAGAAQAGPVPEGGHGTATPRSAGLAGSGVGQHLTTPCEFKKTADCQSVNPGVKTYWTSTGNTSACTFTWGIDWGDKGGTHDVTIHGHAVPGIYPLAPHAYSAQDQKTYTITVTAVSVTGGCTINGGTLKFTLLAYVPLGDSYSAGDGAGSYLSGTGHFGNDCLRSENAYPELLAKNLGNDDPSKAGSTTFDFRACTGAEIPDFSHPQTTVNGERVPAQLGNLDGVSASVGLVTFTIGGNDAGFGPVMEYCATRSDKMPSCKEHSQHDVDAALATIGPKLRGLYSTIKHARRMAKDATVLVLGYPRFFPVRQSQACPTGDPFHKFQPSDMSWINGLIKRLDTEIKAAAAASGITYVDTYSAFNGHELCQAQPWLNEGKLRKILSFHPNERGQEALALLAEAELAKP